MLPLPPCLRGEGSAPDAEVVQALRTTGYFLEQKLAPELGHRPLPEARARFVAAFDHNVRSAAGKNSKRRIEGGQQVAGTGARCTWRLHADERAPTVARSDAAADRQ